MRNLWQTRIYLLLDAAGDAGGGGGSGAGSILTPSGGGGGAGTPPGNPGTPPGAAPGNTPPGTPNAGSPPGGQAPPDWRSALPPELQEDATLKKFSSIPALAGAYISAQKLIGAKSIPLPGEATTEEQWKDIFEKLGVPKEVKDYSVKFKDGVSIDSKFTEEFKANAHKIGMLPKQAQAIADWFSDINLKSEADVALERKTQQDTQFKTLQQEWGKAFDLKASRVNKLFDEHGGAEVKKQLLAMGLGAEPGLMKMLATISDKLYKEDSLNGGGEGGTPQYTPAEAKAEAVKIIADKAHPYNIKDHPGHKGAVDQVKALFEAANPKVQS